jgi:basic amino acid/polyamine antiporter, APA family
MVRNHLERKPIEELLADAYNEHRYSLKRVLGPFHLTMLGVGVIIGAGIFVVTGQAAAQYAGPAIIISFIISAIGCAFAGLCYAEFASMVPVAGSAYTYAYVTLGRFFAWIIGWDLILEYLFGASTVAVGWSGYLNSLIRDFGITLPAAFIQAPLAYHHATGWQVTGAVMNVPAMIIVLLCTVLLVIGIKESAHVNNIIVVVKIAVILLFIGFGIFYIKADNLTPFIPENMGTFGHFGWSGILRGAGVIFFAYIGFDTLSTAAQEVRNPQRDMSIGIIGSLVIATTLYILVTFVLTGIVSYQELGVPEPIGVGVDSLGLGFLWLRPVIKIGAIAGLSSVVLVLLYGQSRIFFSMSKDKMLPENFAKLHPAFRTPHVTTVTIGLAAMLIAGLFPMGMLAEMVSIGTLLAFVIVCISVLVLRKTRPGLHRPFRTPWVPLIPILGALISLLQMVALPLDTWLRLIIWMAVGFIIYFAYGRYHASRQTAGGVDVEPYNPLHAE